MVANSDDEMADFRSLWADIFRWAEWQNLAAPADLADKLTESARRIVAESLRDPSARELKPIR